MATKEKTKVVKSSLAKRNIQKFVRNRMAVIGMVGIAIILFCCIFAPLLTPHDPEFMDPSNRSADPDDVHILGTDKAGRDVFARLLYGGRYSIFIGVTASLCVNIVGCIFGCVAGYFGGKIDKVLVTIQEFFSIFPSTLLYILVIAIFDRSIAVMIGVWTFCGWGGMMRIVRGKIMSLKNEPFVESCRANGVSSASIMFRHMIPNAMGPIIVNVTMNVAGYMLAEAGLSYIGLGVPINTPTWGNIINAAKSILVIMGEPILWLGPGIAMCATILCINFIGDGLRDALDPTSK